MVILVCFLAVFMLATGVRLARESWLGLLAGSIFIAMACVMLWLEFEPLG